MTQQTPSAENNGTGRSARYGLYLGPALCLVLLALPEPSGVSPEAWRTAALASLMAVWWITEAIPLPATALMPLVLFPMAGVGGIRDAAAPYADPVIFLFLGGFLVALAMQRCQLHRRIALNIVARIGTHPAALVPGFMIATAFLSMWVSNTATTMMMMPIAASVAGVILSGARGKNERNFVVALMLGICYSSSIGGIATLIGTPANAILSGYLEQSQGIELSFASWMLFGLPVTGLMLPISWWVLTRVSNPFQLQPSDEVSEKVMGELREMGPITTPEKRVAAIFTLAAVLWMTRPLIASLPGLDGISDAGIAIFCGLALFLIPSGAGGTDRLMDWETTKDMPWGILVLIGGGLSLAGAISDSGLASSIGSSLTALQDWPIVVLIAAVTAMVLLLTELTSNTATAAAFLPIVGGLAIALGISPVQLAAPAAVAASCAFMLPVATAPNAIIYSSGYVTIGQMMRAGWMINLIGIVLITILASVLAPLVLPQ